MKYQSKNAGSLSDGKKVVGEKHIFYQQDKAYFHSQTHINLEATDVEEILSAMMDKMGETFSNYQKLVQADISKKCYDWKFTP